MRFSFGGTHVGRLRQYMDCTCLSVDCLLLFWTLRGCDTLDGGDQLMNRLIAAAAAVSVCF